jgi:hypothetical protein
MNARILAFALASPEIDAFSTSTFADSSGHVASPNPPS